MSIPAVLRNQLETIMTTKKQTTDAFDMLVLRIGYNEYIMPREAALAFIDACSGADIYKHSSRWENGANHSFVSLVDIDEMPSVRLIGPVQFHQGLENHRMEQEKKNAKPAE